MCALNMSWARIAIYTIYTGWVCAAQFMWRGQCAWPRDRAPTTTVIYKLIRVYKWRDVSSADAMALARIVCTIFNIAGTLLYFTPYSRIYLHSQKSNKLHSISISCVPTSVDAMLDPCRKDTLLARDSCNNS